MRRAVRAGYVLAQLRRLIRGLDEHLARTEAGLLRQAGGLLLGEPELRGAGDEVLDEGEEVGGAGTWAKLAMSRFT